MKSHGLSGTREHRAWKHAKSRCYNPNNAKYYRYGARGIVMCEAWRNDFAAFLRDVGHCPPGLTLDRLDNDGPYSPENCRWRTPQEQSNNTRRNHWVTFRGETHTISQWSRLVGIPVSIIHVRLRNHGWTVERALTQRVGMRIARTLAELGL